MFLDTDNNKKTTIFEDLCDKWLDDRTGKPVNLLNSSSVICMYEYKSKTAPKPRCFKDRRSVGLEEFLHSRLDVWGFKKVEN